MDADTRSRILVGAIGGIVGTAAMTAAMRRLHRRLPRQDRYPLPPREITERTVPPPSEEAARDLTLLAHFAFGAAAGSLMSARRVPGPAGGSAWGLIVWLASYLGWVPGARILRPATSHPARRNRLMILVHFVWGSVAAVTAKELLEARRTIFARGELRDAPASSEVHR
jgi:hypothetical protein